MKSTLIGKFKKIIYSSNNFYVVNFKINPNQQEQKSQLNISETLNSINVILNNNDFDFKITYELEIEVKMSPKYGQSFYVKNYSVVVKKEHETIIDYLSSKLFKGISTKTAQKITDNLPLDFIDNPSNFKNELKDLIGETKAEKLIQQLNKQNAFQKIYKQFIQNDLSVNLLNLINVYYPSNKLLDFFEGNILCFIETVQQIDFFELNKIAQVFNKKYDEHEMNDYYLLWLIYLQEFNSGSTINSIESIFNLTKNFKQLSLNEFNHSIENLIENKKVVFNLENKLISSKMIFEKEEYIAKRIKTFLNLTPSRTIIKNYSELDSIQYQALLTSIEKSISIITGGPGTGKTHLIHLIYDSLLEKYRSLDIELLTPTGKAATQINSRKMLGAKTIHSFLKWNKHFFEVNENFPAKTKVIIIDEFSMIDINLFYSILKACPKLEKIILVGDKNQLPAIGPGNLLNDLIESKQIPTTFLEKIYRQKEGSTIAQNSKLINQGLVPSFNNAESNLIEISNEDEVIFIITEYIQNYFKNTKDLLLQDQQILIPQYKNKNGINEINLVIQNLINKNNIPIFKTNFYQYFKNDKVIQLENDLEKNVFNGEIGYIDSVILNSSSNVEEIIVKYNGRDVTYTPSEFIEKTKLAYAISVHKFQGSECKNILFVLSSYPTSFVTKKLFYTGYTRAINQITIISKMKYILQIIQNNLDNDRQTNLANLLK